MNGENMEEDCELLIRVLDPERPGYLKFEEFVQAFMAR